MLEEVPSEGESDMVSRLVEQSKSVIRTSGLDKRAIRVNEDLLISSCHVASVSHACMPEFDLTEGHSSTMLVR